MKTSDYAVAFDFRIKQGSGACEFMTTNGQFDTSSWRGFDLLLYDVDGKIELGRNVWPGDFESAVHDRDRNGLPPVPHRNCDLAQERGGRLCR